jgi:hypothetical protein
MDVVVIIAFAALPIVGMAVLGWRFSKRMDAIATARLRREHKAAGEHREASEREPS